MIGYIKTFEVSFILYALLLSIICLFRYKKGMQIFSFVFILLICCCLGLNKYLNLDYFGFSKILDYKLELWLDCLVSLIILFNVIFTSSNKEKLYKQASEALDKNAYVYLNKKGKVLNYTESFYTTINCYKKNWYKKASFFYNNTSVSYSDLLSSIKDTDDVSFKVTIVLKSDLGDSEYNFNFQKLVIEKDNKVLGYALVNAKVNTTLDGFSLVIDNLDVPYAYYNDSSSNIIYVINKRLKELLNVQGRTLTINELRELVFKDDLQVFDTSINDMMSNSFSFRLNTVDGFKMFNQYKIIKNENLISIISLVDDKNDLVTTKNTISECINNNISTNKPFGGVIVSLNGYLDLFNNNGGVVAKELTNRFVDYCTHSILKSNDLICKISDIEYLLFFNDMNNLDLVVRDICNKTSNLLKYSFNFDEATYESKNTIGIVYSDESVKNEKDFYSNLDMALSFANSNSYANDYSIFQSNMTMNSKISKIIKKEDYSFDNIRISLDNSFLDEDE